MRFLSFLILAAVARADAPAPSSSYLLKPSRVFDGESMHDGWAVVVVGDKIESAGPAAELKAPEAAKVVELPGATLLPGLIEAHSHILLHPYTEASWNDQVARESEALRVARATNHLRATLLAGFTTIRDLGTEGAGWADVGLKQAVERGIIAGPRMLVATKAIVATGSYGPRGFSAEWNVPQGGAEASGVPDLIRETRNQIGHGADWIKVYADYRWMPRNFPQCPFARYADDAVVHCRSQEQAQEAMQAIASRLAACGLTMHPEKSKIVYCKDRSRTHAYPNVTFTFLGFQFRPRRAQTKHGHVSTSFLPGVSPVALKRMRDQVRGWRLTGQTSKPLGEVAKQCNPTIRGWWNYYGAFYRSAMHGLCRYLDRKLVRWARRKYKPLRRHRRRGEEWLQ